MRVGEKQWLSNERRDVCIGADIARPLAFEPSVTERLYKLALKAVGKNTWDHDNHPCLSALKHARMALAEAEPPAATGKQPTQESTDSAAAAEDPATKSTDGAATAEPTNTESAEGTVPDADVKAVDEDAASEACDASGVVTETCEPPPVQG